MYRCKDCNYVVKTPPVPRKCPQCKSPIVMMDVQLKEIAVKK